MKLFLLILTSTLTLTLAPYLLANVVGEVIAKVALMVTP